jgi:hypothetical protein
MEFRWVAALALWTMLSGPILSQPAPSRPAALARPVLTSPIKPSPEVTVPARQARRCRGPARGLPVAAARWRYMVAESRPAGRGGRATRRPPP